MKNIFSTKPTILVSIFVLALVAMPKTYASVAGPTITSPDNLKVILPSTLKANKTFSVVAEAQKYQLSANVTEVVYNWRINTCGTTQVVTKNLSQDVTAYKHYFDATFKQGCTIKIDVSIHSYAGNTLVGSAGHGSIDAKLTSTDDVTLTGPSIVKVGTNAEYKAVYQMDSTQKAVWYKGTSCRIVKTGGTPFNGVNETGFTFHWEPKKAQSCNIEAVGVYTSNNSLGMIEAIEIANSKLLVKSVN